LLFVAVGPILSEALRAADILKEQGVETDVVSARFAKPVDTAIIDLFAQDKTVIIAEDHSLSCGFGSATLEEAVRAAAASDDTVMQRAIGRTVLLAGPDGFIPAAARHRQLAWIGLTAERMVEAVRQIAAGESVGLWRQNP
jgi:1-deoxy-D-xylulose-5-phosphate synthase